MAIERTFSIIKPDAVAKNVIGGVTGKLEAAGLRILASKMVRLTEAQAKAFYAVHKERPFYNDLVKFMTEGPVVVQVLEGEDAVSVEQFRQLDANHVTRCEQVRTAFTALWHPTERPVVARHRAELAVHRLHHFAFQLEACGRIGDEVRILQHREGHRHLALELVGHAHHRHLGHGRMAGDALLDLARAEAVAGHVDDVVGAAEDEEVAVLVAHAPVEGGVDPLAGQLFPVGADEAGVVAPHGLHAARGQRAFDADHALDVAAGEFLTGLVVQQLDVVAVHRLAG